MADSSKLVECDIVVQAGHQNTPDGRTGAESRWGKEIEWTPIVADRAVKRLKEAGINAVKADASIKKTKLHFKCRVGVFLHFDGAEGHTSGASVGYPDNAASKQAATGWKEAYSRYKPNFIGWMPDNFTADEHHYYGFGYVFASQGEFLIEFGDMDTQQQALWMKDRLEWMGDLLAHYLSKCIGNDKVADPGPPSPTQPGQGESTPLAPDPAPVRTSLYSPPPESIDLLRGIRFSDADPSIGKKYLEKFKQYDATKAKNDPSCCVALLRFPDGTVFFEAKMAIDADGSPRAREIDPDGDDNTSFRFPDRSSLNAETVPYIVLPETNPKKDPDSFLNDFALRTGDLAIVIYRNKLTGAIVGDLGPTRKIGEGSIHLHQRLMPAAPDPWKKPGKLRNSSISGKVLYFVFSNSIPAGITPGNIEAVAIQEAQQRFDSFLRAQRSDHRSPSIREL